MNIEDSDRRLAVLIDAENVPAKSLDGVFLELKKLGIAAARRIYGDFDGPQAEPWTKYLIRHAVTPHHQLSFGRRKNANDIALVIDAMDLLHSGSYDGFVIVSSDTDFVRLAIRIREQGLPVYVFGGIHSPERLRNAATRFFYFENLYRHAPANDPNSRTKPLRDPRTALPMLKEVVTHVTGEPGNWMLVDELEEEIAQYVNDFDPRSYGHLQFIKHLDHLAEVVVDRANPGGPRMRIKTRKGKRARQRQESDIDTKDAAESLRGEKKEERGGPAVDTCTS